MYVEDQVEVAFGGFVGLTLRGGKRELLRLEHITAVRRRREGGCAIVLENGATLLVSVDAEDVIEVMRQAGEGGGSYATP